MGVVSLSKAKTSKKKKKTPAALGANVIQAQAKAFTVILSHECDVRIRQWIKRAGQDEVSGFGQISIDEDRRVINVTRVWLPPQENSCGATDSTAQGVSEWLGKLIMEDDTVDAAMIRYWWHLHPGNIGAFWSGTDHQNIEELLKAFQGRGLLASTVFTPRPGEEVTRVDLLEPRICFDKQTCKFLKPDFPDLIKQADDEYDASVKPAARFKNFPSFNAKSKTGSYLYDLGYGYDEYYDVTLGYCDDGPGEDTALQCWKSHLGKHCDACGATACDYYGYEELSADISEAEDPPDVAALFEPEPGMYVPEYVQELYNDTKDFMLASNPISYNDQQNCLFATKGDDCFMCDVDGCIFTYVTKEQRQCFIDTSYILAQDDKENLCDQCYNVDCPFSGLVRDAPDLIKESTDNVKEATEKEVSKDEHTSTKGADAGSKGK